MKRENLVLKAIEGCSNYWIQILTVLNPVRRGSSQGEVLDYILEGIVEYLM